MDLNSDELLVNLPVSLVSEIMFYSHRDFINKFFQEFKSENLIRDISLKLKTKTYMPDDVVYKRTETSNDTYFIVEGSIGIFDKKGNLMTKLRAGAQFGEGGLYGFKKRSMTAKSTAFCIVKVL